MEIVELNVTLNTGAAVYLTSFASASCHCNTLCPCPLPLILAKLKYASVSNIVLEELGLHRGSYVTTLIKWRPASQERRLPDL